MFTYLYLFFTFARKPTGIISIAWVIDLQNSSYKNMLINANLCQSMLLNLQYSSRLDPGTSSYFEQLKRHTNVFQIVVIF